MPAPSLDLVMWLHTGSALYLCGLIWFVQLVHYPLMARVGSDAYPAYARQHQRLTTLVVAPAMLIEAITAILLFVAPESSSTRPLATTGLALVACIWASTIWLQVPCHERLGRGYDSGAVRRLVRTNWIRTVAWSARGGIAMAMLVAYSPATP